jgi:bacillithiol synthase
VSELTVRTVPMGGSTLARAVADGALAAGLPPAPRDAAAWRRRADEVRRHPGRTDWAERLAPAFAARGAAEARLARASQGRGIVITTGQQPGLFGGPIYTWSKALSALALADAVEAATGVPTAPVFWAATDDADFAEAAETWVALPGGAEHISLPRPPIAGLPLADVPLGDVREQLAVLARAAGSAAHPEPLRLVERTYHPRATVGGAYLGLLRGLLEPLGIAVLDASHPQLRARADGLLRRALRRADGLDDALTARAAALREAGFEPQVSQVPGLSLVFERPADGAKSRVPLQRAAAVADDGAATLSSTVLLRPVVERHLLPTAAYVAGPGELAYFAQVGAVAEALDAEPPLALPRWSCTIIEPHVAELLDRYGLGEDDFREPHAAERSLASTLLPARVHETLRDLRAAVERAGVELREAGATLLPDAVPDGFARRTGERLDRLERRYRAAVKRAEAGAFRDLGTLRGALYPGGVRQERALNLLPTLARHGPGVLDLMLDGARAHAGTLVHGAPPVVEARRAAPAEVPL